METPKEFFIPPEGWSWERDWDIEPMKSSMQADDFVLREWTDQLYETIDMSDPDFTVTQWFNKVIILVLRFILLFNCNYLSFHLQAKFEASPDSNLSVVFNFG